MNEARMLATFRRACFVVLLLTLSLVGVAHGAALTPLKATELPAIPSQGEMHGLAQLDGRTVALIGDGAWALDAGASAWVPLAWSGGHPPAGLDRSFGDGKRAYVMLRNGGKVTAVARLIASTAGLEARVLPALPQPLDDAQATVSGSDLFVVGRDGEGSTLWRLDVDAPGATWTSLGGWPSHAAPTTVVAQGMGVFVTTDDAIWRWTAEEGWSRRSDLPAMVLPGMARAVGQANILYLVADGAGPARAMTWQIVTRSWATLPGATFAQPQAMTPWGDGLLWARSADERTQVGSAEIQSGKLLLRWLDWLVIVVYLAGMIGIGLYFYLREKRNSTSNFFVGGRSIPFWAAGISLYAANTSSISFIAIPAKAFESNWQYMTNNLIAVFGLMFVAVWIVPLLRRLDLMSVFSYLETRFHPTIRMLASALCILTQLGSRMSVILFLPALAIATITGISTTWSVILMGGFTIVYTAMGGMKAVIWTDVVQVIVKMGGAIFAIGFIIWHLHGGMGEFVHTAMADHKLRLLDFSFDLTKATVWGFIFLVLFDVVLTFPKDQVLMQRTLSTPSDKEAGRSIWAFAAIMIPGGFVFYMIGTALFVYYKAHPERMNPLLPIDATFPLFIAAELPMGVTGLIVAGIFAAAMATLSGIMNSVATLVSVDFYERLVKNPTPKHSVVFAEITTIVVGLVGIGLALLLSRFDVHSLFDVSIELAGLLGGGFAGAYTLGMFTRRANAPGVAIGIAASTVLTLVAWMFKLVHPYFYLAISIFLCIVIGYIASLFFPPPTGSLKGLTIHRDNARR
ncbi:sodium/solute symporter [Luteibacter flocculans]|uniref:Sodium/solute symporter n=2 Tax=Luteibacter flocculans TaxID=2780091 RepID=A0ABY4T447_9GAMM|nr:sodium/solute symporter [Luteibacter flocculans]